MRISDWSSDVCSSDLRRVDRAERPSPKQSQHMQSPDVTKSGRVWSRPDHACRHRRRIETRGSFRRFRPTRRWTAPGATSSPAFRPSRALRERAQARSEEHTSELQSLMRISYAVFCFKKKTKSLETKTVRLTRYTIKHKIN